MSKPAVCLNDEPAEDDKTVEIEECGRCITRDSLRLAKNFGQPEATCSQRSAYRILWSALVNI